MTPTDPTTNDPDRPAVAHGPSSPTINIQPHEDHHLIWVLNVIAE